MFESFTTTLKMFGGLLSDNDKTKIKRMIRYSFYGVIFFMIVLTSLGFISGYIYATELQETRCLNTLIYSFQKVKAHNFAFNVPANDKSSLKDFDVVVPDDIKNNLNNTREFSVLMEDVNRRIVKGILILDKNLSVESLFNNSYNIKLDEQMHARPSQD